MRDRVVAAYADILQDRGDGIIDAILESRRAIEQAQRLRCPGTNLPEHSRSIRSPATIELLTAPAKQSQLFPRWRLITSSCLAASTSSDRTSRDPVWDCSGRMHPCL